MTQTIWLIIRQRQMAGVECQHHKRNRRLSLRESHRLKKSDGIMTVLERKSEFCSIHNLIFTCSCIETRLREFTY